MFAFIVQGIGLVALAFQIIAFLEKNDKKLFFHLGVSSFFWALHFYFLGLLSGSYVNVVDILKNYTGYKKFKSKYVFWVLFFLYLFASFLVYNYTFIGLIPLVCSLLSIYSVFYSRGEKLRLFYIITTFLWLIYTIFGFSIPGILTNIFLLFELAYTYHKIHSTKRTYKKRVSQILTK